MELREQLQSGDAIVINGINTKKRIEDPDEYGDYPIIEINLIHGMADAKFVENKSSCETCTILQFQNFSENIYFIAKMAVSIVK